MPTGTACFVPAVFDEGRMKSIFVPAVFDEGMMKSSSKQSLGKSHKTSIYIRVRDGKVWKPLWNYVHVYLIT